MGTWETWQVMVTRAEVAGWKHPRNPRMRLSGVSGAIVLGGRESRPHGEGRQLVGISTQNSRMLTGMKFP
jgi:hypothetical protein